MTTTDPRTVLVTGATNGIGRAAALELARRGAHVVAVGRDPDRTRAVVDAIGAEGGSAEARVADLSSQAEVRRLAEEVGADHERLDVLLNNAGAIFRERDVTVDGIERTFALNHLAYFLLTNLLLDRLSASAPARVVNVASRAQERGRLDFDDLQNERDWSMMRAYGDSKLANVMFTAALARRIDGTGVTTYSMHPGFVGTGFAANNGGLLRLGMKLVRPFIRSPERGADTAVWLCEAAGIEKHSGGYFVDRRRVDPVARARDTDAQERLWEVSARMTGLAPVS
jgi:NAD(P)-dependent dehydrogenase (short-subunit alcohol dehydrogenase family)